MKGRSSFLLDQKGKKVKAKIIGPSHGSPKRLIFKSGSAFFRPFLLKEKDQKFKADINACPRSA